MPDWISEEGVEAAPHAVREVMRKLIEDSGPTRRRQIGERREKLFIVAPGFYPPVERDSKAELIEVADNAAPLVRVDVLNYRNPFTRSDPGWLLIGWREPTEEELAEHYQTVATRIAYHPEVGTKQAPQRTWLRRLWWRMWLRQLWWRIRHPHYSVLPVARIIQRDQ
jgi:hypothetical protein